MCVNVTMDRLVLVPLLQFYSKKHECPLKALITVTCRLKITDTDQVVSGLSHYPYIFPMVFCEIKLNNFSTKDAWRADTAFGSWLSIFRIWSFLFTFQDGIKVGIWTMKMLFLCFQSNWLFLFQIQSRT